MGRISQMSVETLIAAPDRGTYRVAVFVAALVASACAASAIDQDSATPIFDHPPAFGDRFAFSEAPVRWLEKSALRPLARNYSTDLGTLQRAKTLLAQKLEEFRADGSLATGQRDARNESVIPVPRSRPVQANLDLEKARANGAGGQTLFDKIAGWFAGRPRLASLTPDADSSDGSNIRSLGVDDHTAVYDISARAVYMPGGAKLEAHSGYGGLRDSPDHVSERDVGATPPAFYDLRPRESLFHGVQALRMIPVDGQSTLGRDGLLAHGYMLGPDGDSNGCVSIKDYEKFLAAFQNGEVNRLLVVTSLGAAGRIKQAQL